MRSLGERPSGEVRVQVQTAGSSLQIVGVPERRVGEIRRGEPVEGAFQLRATVPGKFVIGVATKSKLNRPGAPWRLNAR